MNFLKRNKFLLILFWSVFLLRLPSLFEPYWYGDEGIYLAIGMAIKKGLLLYRDVLDNKPPLIYLLAGAVDGKIFWFKLSLTLSVLATTFFFYRFSQRIFEKEKTAKISTVCVAVFTTLRSFEGNVVNSEILILLPTIIGLFLFFPILGFQKKGKAKLSCWKYLFASIILGLGFLLKAPAIFDFASVMVFLIFLKKTKVILSFGKNEIVLIAGYFLPIILICLFFLFKGAFGQFFESSFTQTFGYLSSWKTGSHVFSPLSLFKSDFFIRTMLVVIIFVSLWIKRSSSSSLMNFLSLWFVFSLYGATLSGRPYPHYLVQIILPLSIIIAHFSQKRQKTAIAVGVSLVALLVFALIRYRFWTYTTIPYYQNFLGFILGKKDKNSYFSYFSPKLPQIYKVAETVIINTNPEDKLFVWANEPYLYPLTRRLPATRYLVAYHIIDLNHFDDTSALLTKQPPTIIVLDKNEKKFLQLERIVKNDYLKIQTTDNFEIYKKM